MHDICCTILHGECTRIKIRGKWHFRRAVCVHNTEHLHSNSKGITGGNAENAQHAQNAPHAVQRHSQRQDTAHVAHVAQGSVCVFFLGGVEPQIPYHTAICSGGGEGFNPDSPTTEKLATRVVSFFAGHHQFVCAGRTPATTCPIAIILHYCTAQKPVFLPHIATPPVRRMFRKRACLR